MTLLEVDDDDITQGPLARVLVLVAVPLLAQNFARIVERLVDLFWLGRLSGSAVAAVGLVTPVIQVCFTLVITSAFVGTQILVSQRVGADDERGAEVAAATGVTVGLAGGLLVAVFGYVGTDALVAAVTAVTGSRDAAVLDQAGTYLRIVLAGSVIAAVSDVVEAAFVGRGDSRAALYMNLVSVAANVALSPVLMFGLGPVPRLEIAGAALGTVLSYVAGALLGVGFVATGRAGGIVSADAFEFEVAEFRELLSVGVPQGLQGASAQSSRVVMTLLVLAAGGSAGLTAYTIGSRVATFAFVPSIGFKQAAQSVVGQNVGADRPDRATRTTWLGVGMAGGLLALLGAVQLAIPSTIASVVAPALGGEGLDLTVRFLRIYALAYPAIGALALFQAGFDGVRRTRTSLAFSLLQNWLVMLPVAYVAGIYLGRGVEWVFWSVVVANVVVAVLIGGYFAYNTSRGMMREAAVE